MINTNHEYRYEDGGIIDCFGDKMNSLDEYVDELQTLIDEIKLLKNELGNGIKEAWYILDDMQDDRAAEWQNKWQDLALGP